MQRGVSSVIEDFVTLSCVEVSFNLPKIIKNVILIPDSKSLNIESADSEYRVTIPTLKMHCALVFHY